MAGETKRYVSIYFSVECIRLFLTFSPSVYIYFLHIGMDGPIFTGNLELFGYADNRNWTDPDEKRHYSWMEWIFKKKRVIFKASGITVDNIQGVKLFIVPLPHIGTYPKPPENDKLTFENLRYIKFPVGGFQFFFFF